MKTSKNCKQQAAKVAVKYCRSLAVMTVGNFRIDEKLISKVIGLADFISPDFDISALELRKNIDESNNKRHMAYS